MLDVDPADNTVYPGVQDIIKELKVRLESVIGLAVGLELEL